MRESAKIKVAILGSTGMLGGMVRRYLAGQPGGYDLTCPSHGLIDAEHEEPGVLASCLRGHDYAINCIGLIKPRINVAAPASVERAIRVNSLFPHLLARAAVVTGTKVLQIATDCVYSGRLDEGPGYDESALSDATDIYGKSKSLGEVVSPAVRHLRCSIVGPESAGRPKDSLLEWFLGQPAGATVRGFTNHLWNGLTTLAFARICDGIMREGIAAGLPPLQHVVPADSVTKSDLLSCFAHHYRKDIQIDEVAAPTLVDRRLRTARPLVSATLWQAAGYARVPTVGEMVEELAAHQREEVSA